MSPSLKLRRHQYSALRFDDEEDALHLSHILQNAVQRRLDHLLAGLNAAPAVRPHSS